MEGRGRTTESDCRLCTSFSDFVKTNKFLKKTNSQDNDKPVNRRTDCPIDKDQLGSCSWALLHTIATRYPDRPTDNQKTDMKQFLTLFAKLYPCEVCAEDFQKDMEKYKPVVESNKTLSNWLCEMHNRVNQKIGKKLFDCQLIQQRWRDGWADGSCDL